ncbi:hypothetical protein [Nocardiopsis alba]|uniref:hypothetical protein n=1 Tax=Nocardiopsis alba TaxID=53437 RepID=UPI00034A9994|nr:hypothetical protein [Nocardiopsis alba]
MGSSAAGGGLGPRPWTRALIIGAGAVLLAGAAVGGGLVLAGDDPDRPDGDDALASAPTCASIPEDAVLSALPGATPETEGHGPLAGGESSTCVWTSLAPDGEGRGSLRVDLSARFTDASAEPVVTGERAAVLARDAAVPVRGEQVDLAGGTEVGVWRGRLPGTAELAFQRDNMLVRVSYVGEADGEPVSFGRARDTVVDFAARLEETL